MQEKKMGALRLMTIEGRRYLQFPALEEAGLRHAFTSRDLNLKITGREGSEALQAAYREALEGLGFSHAKMYTMQQVHSTTVEVVDMRVAGEDLGFATRIGPMDGMMSNFPGVLLSSGYADCVPLLLFDPVKKAQANLHSGWRGSLNGILTVALEKMQSRYGSKPEELLLGIGPHIGREDFFVQEDVASQFQARYPALEGLVRQVSSTHALVDLELLLRHQALTAGLLPEHLYSSGLSTVAETDLLHSFRRDKEAFGIMNVFSQIRPYRPKKLCNRFRSENILCKP